MIAHAALLGVNKNSYQIIQVPNSPAFLSIVLNQTVFCKLFCTLDYIRIILDYTLRTGQGQSQRPKADDLGLDVSNWDTVRGASGVVIMVV